MRGTMMSVFVGVWIAGTSAGVSSHVVPTGLTCEYCVNPVGIDVEKPRLGWEICECRIQNAEFRIEKAEDVAKGSGIRNSEFGTRHSQIPRGLRQTACQVLVAGSEELLAKDQGDLWDSGKVESGQSIQVGYQGKPLESRQRCYWKVRVWLNDGMETQWSKPAWFVTGKLRQEDWKGKWIGADATTEKGVGGVLGYASEAGSADSTRWVQVDLGAAKRIDKIVLHPMLHNDEAAGGWIKGYGFPLRFRIDVSDDAGFKVSGTVIDQTGSDYANPGYAKVEFDTGGKTARYVRLTATKLWHRGQNLPYVFTLGEIQVFSGGQNIAQSAAVSANSSVEGYGWSSRQLTDGKALVVEAKPQDEGKVVRRRNPHGAIYMRKEFACEKKVKRAVAYFCGLGFSELYIDGKKVGDYVIGPGFTTYDKRTQYLVFDVTDLLGAPGKKRMDVVLADGWYALERDPWVHGFHNKPYTDKPKLLLNLHLEYQDGSETVVVSDESWKWSEGEITRSWIAGEDIDLREAGENRRTWRPVAAVNGPEGKLVCQKEPFCKVVERVSPVSMTYDPAGKTAVWDLGREIDGWARFSAAGPSGTVISITTVPENLTKRTSKFTLAGNGGKETYEPRFFYAGIRKVEVGGLVESPATNDLVGCQVSSMYVPSGGFRCSDEGVTALHDAVRRTVVSYTTFLPNDPVREWKAWTQDIENMFWSAVYLFDSRKMYERWQLDLIDGQAENGNCPNIAPGPGYDAYNSPWWGGCVVWLPWEYYIYYGDDTLLRDGYPAMKRYVDFLGKAGKEGLQYWGLLDWLPVEETPQAIINTSAYYLYAQTVARTAKMLGRADEANEYELIAGKVKDRFNSEFLDPATGIYGQRDWKVRHGNWNPPLPMDKMHDIWWTGDRPCTQAAQVLPLALGMVPAENRDAVQKALLKEIAAHRDKVSTGFVSTPYLLKVLADLDPEAGWRMASTREFPSWYYMTFGKGGDLMKETWAGGQALMPSLGGNIAAWHMESLGGIRPDPSGPGFKKIIIRPNIVGDLRWVECWHDSNHGRIVSNWKREDKKLQMDVAIPINTIATVHVPARESNNVTESGKPAAKAKGVKFLRMEEGRAVYEVGSGCYRFCSEK